MLRGSINQGPLVIFDQILTKFVKILIIYVKNHQIHVKKIQGRHFLRKKKPLRECQHTAQGLIISKIHQHLLKSIKINSNQLKTITINQKYLKSIKHA